MDNRPTLGPKPMREAADGDGVKGIYFDRQGKNAPLV
jgi:hypothetical protein